MINNTSINCVNLMLLMEAKHISARRLGKMFNSRKCHAYCKYINVHLGQSSPVESYTAVLSIHSL